MRMCIVGSPVRWTGPFFKRRTWWVWVFGLAIPVWSGCEGSGVARPEATPAESLYWLLEVDHRAVMLSLTPPYDRLQLTAVPRNATGEPLPGYPPATYRSTDQDVVLVTPDGILQARRATLQPVKVVVRLTANNVTHTDTVLVAVVDDPDPPVLKSLSIQPIPPDSAKFAASTGSGIVAPAFIKALSVSALDDTDTPISGLPVRFRSSDPTTLVLYDGDFSGIVQGIRPGIAAIYASTTAFGVVKADTLPYRIGLPLVAEIPLSKTAEGVPRPLDVHDRVAGAGSFIIWRTPASSVFDLSFAPDNVADVAPASAATTVLALPQVGFFLNFACLAFGLDCVSAGDGISSTTTAFGQAVARAFPVSGTYVYHSDSLGIRGRLIVKDDP